MRAAWLLPLGLAACAPPPSGEMLTMRAERVIAAPLEVVWAHAADPLTEEGYRRERLSFEADGPLAVGTTYIETIDVGLVNGYRMAVRVSAIDAGRRVRLEAVPGLGRHFTAERVFLPEGDGTRMIYTVEAEDRVLRDIALLPVPLWLAEIVYEADMKVYLRRLAEAVEG